MSNQNGNEEHDVKMSCESASALVPRYLDGELQEPEVGPLRGHLLDCPRCREVAKDGKALQRWFVDPAELRVPSGFAARVARRAFAGDPGVLLPPASSRPGPRPLESAAPSLQPFILKLAAIAAVVLFVFSLLLQSRTQPIRDISQGLDAQVLPPALSDSTNESAVNPAPDPTDTDEEEDPRDSEEPKDPR